MFQELSLIIGNAMERGANLVVPLQKKILFTIWMLSKPESFLAAGDRFSLAKSTGHMIFKQIVQILINLLPQFITWATPEQQQVSINVSIF